MVRAELSSITVQECDVSVSFARGCRAGIEFELPQPDGRTVHIEIGYRDLMRLARGVKAKEEWSIDKKYDREFRKRAKQRALRKFKRAMSGGKRKRPMAFHD